MVPSPADKTRMASLHMSRKIGQIVRGQNRNVPKAKLMAQRDRNNHPIHCLEAAHTVYVGRLSCQVEDGQYLRTLFGHCGQIRSAKVVRKGECHSHTGFGFVRFHCLESVYLALRLNDTMDNASGSFLRVERYQKKNKIVQQRYEGISETKVETQPVQNSRPQSREQQMEKNSKFQLALKEARARLKERARNIRSSLKTNNDENWQQKQAETKGYHRNGTENPKSEEARSSSTEMSFTVFGSTVPHAKKNDPSITIPWRPIGLKLHDPRLIIPPNLRIQTVTNNLELPAFGVSFLRDQFLGKNGRKMAVNYLTRSHLESQNIRTKSTKSVHRHVTKIVESPKSTPFPRTTPKLAEKRPTLKLMPVSSDSSASSSNSSSDFSNKFIEKRPNLKRMMILSDSSSSSSSDSSSISSSSSDDECDDEDDYSGANAPKRAKFSKNGGGKTDNDDDVLFLPKTGMTVRGPPRMEFQKYFGDEDSEEEGAEEDNGPSPGAKLATEFAKMKSTRGRMIKMLEIVKKSD